MRRALFWFDRFQGYLRQGGTSAYLVPNIGHGKFKNHFVISAATVEQFSIHAQVFNDVGNRTFIWQTKDYVCFNYIDFVIVRLEPIVC